MATGIAQHRPPEGGHVLADGSLRHLGTRARAGPADAAGHRLHLSDLLPFSGSDASPSNVLRPPTSQTEQRSAAACPDDVTDIVHFGGINTEKDPEAILQGQHLGHAERLRTGPRAPAPA
jgi:uronate dehydrogenase